MKKIALLIVSAILLGACTHDAATTTEQSSSVESDEFAAVAEAMQAGKPATCTLTKQDGTGEMTYHVKGEKVRVSGMTNELTAPNVPQYSAMLMDGEYIYTWDDTTKEGVKFPIPDSEDTTVAQNQPPAVPNITDESTRDQYTQQGYDIECSASDVADSMFIPPVDVTFTDMSALVPNTIPSVPTIQPGDDMTPEEQQALQDQAKRMMQQYGQE